MEPLHLLGQTQADLESWARARGAREGGARALARALLAEAAGRTAAPGEAPSQRLLAEAEQQFDRTLPAAEPVVDPDGTIRFAVTLGDGNVVETVLIHQAAGDEDDPHARRRERYTVCVSTQVGCARGCVFCETGRLGLRRNLEAHEIVAQFALAVRFQESRRAPRPENLVYMGMGEPLDNLGQVVRSIDVLRERTGFAVAERRITVSTVGIVPKLDELYARTRVNLAVSLHALVPEVRRSLLPVARRWELPLLREAIARSPRTVLLQWTLIAGENDADADAALLASFCAGLDVRVNLIPLNPGPVAAQRAPTLERCRGFQKLLQERGVRTLLRLPHGQAVGGACGQLAGSRRNS